MGQQHDFYLVQSGNLVPRSAHWRDFLACFQQPSPLRSANLDSSDIPYAGPQSGGGGGNWADEHDEYRSLIEQELPILMPKGGVLLMNSLAFHSVGVNLGPGTRKSVLFACHSSDNTILSGDSESTILLAGERQFKGNPVLRVSGSLEDPAVACPSAPLASETEND